MAYRFSTGSQPVSHQIRRIFLEEIDSAIEHLQNATVEDRDYRVHESRKHIKKIRALLRLIAHQLGQRMFRRENRRFRNIARQLSGLRDAQSIIESFVALPEGMTSKTAKRTLLKRLDEQKRSVFEAQDSGEVLRFTAEALQLARPHLESFVLDEDGFAAVNPGFLEFYRKGRAALQRARENSSAENLHDFRKRVKDHWYHTRLFSGRENKFLQNRQGRLRELETLLGEAHNLFVLRETLVTGGLPKRVMVALEGRENELSRQALLLSQSLYSLKPREWRKEFSDSMKVWTSSSESVRTAMSSEAPSGISPAKESSFMPVIAG